MHTFRIIPMLADKPEDEQLQKVLLKSINKLNLLDDSLGMKANDRCEAPKSP